MKVQKLPVAIGSPDRAQQVKKRLIEINHTANSLVIENGMLLREMKANGYWKEEGYKSFDEAINTMQANGELDYGARNARNFIAIVNMIDNHKLEAADVAKIPVSKLREIAALPLPDDQRALLKEANNLTVAEVQLRARKLRDKAYGRETDPLAAVTLMLSESQKKFFNECIDEARRVFADKDTTPVATILVDRILADFFHRIPEIEAELIEGELA